MSCQQQHVIPKIHEGVNIKLHPPHYQPFGAHYHNGSSILYQIVINSKNFPTHRSCLTWLHSSRSFQRNLVSSFISAHIMSIRFYFNLTLKLQMNLLTYEGYHEVIKKTHKLLTSLHIHAIIASYSFNLWKNFLHTGNSQSCQHLTPNRLNVPQTQCSSLLIFHRVKLEQEREN